MDLRSCFRFKHITNLIGWITIYFVIIYVVNTLSRKPKYEELYLSTYEIFKSSTNDAIPC